MATYSCWYILFKWKKIMIIITIYRLENLIHNKIILLKWKLVKNYQNTHWPPATRRKTLVFSSWRILQVRKVAGSFDIKLPYLSKTHPFNDLTWSSFSFKQNGWIIFLTGHGLLVSQHWLFFNIKIGVSIDY